MLDTDLWVGWLGTLEPEHVEEDVADGQGLFIASPLQAVVEQVITVTMGSEIRNHAFC